MTFSVPESEIEWRFSGSGGPGGQHANTSNTRVEAVWNVTASAAPSARQRVLIVSRLGPEVRVVASDSRSQTRNRELALARLQARVTAALRVDPPRRPTRPTRAAQERRLDAKRRRSARKQSRREEDQ